MDIKHLSIGFIYLTFAAIGADVLAVLLAWIIGVLFVIIYYGKTLQQERGAFPTLIFSTLIAPIAMDFIINYFTNWMYINRAQYLITPFVVFSLFSFVKYSTNSYTNEQKQYQE